MRLGLRATSLASPDPLHFLFQTEFFEFESREAVIIGTGAAVLIGDPGIDSGVTLFQ